MSFISPNLAHGILTDLTRKTAGFVEPNALLDTSSVRRHGHVLVGDVALRCYKHQGRWRYLERDIRRAGEMLSAVCLDPNDRVDAQLPPDLDDGRGETSQEEWRTGWRRRLTGWMFNQAYLHSRRRETPSDHRDWRAWKSIGDNGLPGGLTWEDFVTASEEHRYWHMIAGTRPLPLLSWSGETWNVPRAFADLLDRWARVESELTGRSLPCSNCGARGPAWGGWRMPTKHGYVTMCPPCSGAAFRAYPATLRGVPYSSPRRRRIRADDYLCSLCRGSRAGVWDHCHDHGFVRGPLCGSCNSAEGNGTAQLFLEREGALLHLLECLGCRERRTLPFRYHAEYAAAHLQQTERHGNCQREPYVQRFDFGPENGEFRFTIHCDRHAAKTWKSRITTAEAALIVRAAVDRELADEQDSPGKEG